jgi:hypothetical protein
MLTIMIIIALYFVLQIKDALTVQVGIRLAPFQILSLNKRPFFQNLTLSKCVFVTINTVLLIDLYVHISQIQIYFRNIEQCSE